MSKKIRQLKNTRYTIASLTNILCIVGIGVILSFTPKFSPLDTTAQDESTSKNPTEPAVIDRNKPNADSQSSEKSTLDKAPDSTESLPTSETAPLHTVPKSETSKQSTTPSIVSGNIYDRAYVLGDYIYDKTSNVRYPLRIYKTFLAPNDPQSGQWWSNSLRLEEFWNSTTGSSQTTLAIIDTGFALNHEEFQGRWATNSQETGPTLAENNSLLNCTDRSLPVDKNCNLIDDDFDGVVDNEVGITSYENQSQYNCSDQLMTIDKSCNLVDDDGNGLIDDWRGFDFVNYDRSSQAGETNPNGTGTHHASYVTGVAAANANNGVGIAGVNWQTKILPLQAIDDDGYANSLTVARAVDYAVAQGVDVISMSLGGAYPDTVLRQAIEEAVTAGIIIVAASGNDGCNCIAYPANYPDVLAVGALAQDGSPATFSSYGANLDILAPGTGIYTTTWTPSNQTSAYANGIAGTSLATPLVSGLITSLKSQYPAATSLELLATLTNTTNRLTLSANEVHSDYLGFGFANPYETDQRLRSAKNSFVSYQFNPIIAGLGSSPGEITLRQCNPSERGTTAIHQLAQSKSVLYTTSQSVRYRAEQLGYKVSRLGYSCVVLPQDTSTTIRSINTAQEFFNTFVKL